MRKIEVKPDGVGDFVIGEDYFSEGEIESIFGEIPQGCETRSYYIVPAGDVVEFQLRQPKGDKTKVSFVDMDDMAWFTVWRSYCERLFNSAPDGDKPLNVTAIVHPADSQSVEETVEANEPDWLSEPDDVGVWWIWDKKSPPVMCSVYDSVSRTGLMCRTFNGREKFTYQLSHEGHVFCRLEYVDLQQWYFKRDKPKKSVADRAVERLRDFTERLEAGEDIEGIPTEKQPIILKRNNVPTRPGNYARGLRNPDVSHATKVVSHHMDGTLGFYDSSGVWNIVAASQWWSDELGPIEFQAEPEPPPPPMPKVGWFEYKGERHTVCELEDDDVPQQPYVVTPAVCTREFGLSRWQSPESLNQEGIHIKWYGDAQ